MTGSQLVQGGGRRWESRERSDRTFGSVIGEAESWAHEGFLYYIPIYLKFKF